MGERTGTFQSCSLEHGYCVRNGDICVEFQVPFYFALASYRSSTQTACLVPARYVTTLQQDFLLPAVHIEVC